MKNRTRCSVGIPLCEPYEKLEISQSVRLIHGTIVEHFA